ncbi:MULTISPECIES: hypothetical protein [unclassified Lactococcus]|uniref:hypothetical protein n=1 Tax=unclassified Lactococcus TaxID=2643510 RepID=UPI0011CA4EE4|nr:MULTISPECIES: hypothetical protein [unclassified Lactococcus]MQW23435.1 hypothetical protein [Lactococcus sp. dk101]TXK37053.1 hypothetical protein FVP42_10025 [Lactococcus sp. dk310]TXK37285.1 hypothetical protein FVP42_09255 [Lactococcus sp. dk310]TXK47719.1 hypothetical protein FVP43_09830 [Lactococcus sp. dk322]
MRIETFDLVFFNEQGVRENYSIMATDLFEADKRGQEIAHKNGWIHTETNPRLPKNQFEERLQMAETSEPFIGFGQEQTMGKKR